MELESTKLGEADQAAFQVSTGDGNSGAATEAIVPILKQLEDTSWRLIGTGFFITTSGVILTAKHVMMDVVDSNGQQKFPAAICQFLPQNSYLIRPIIRFSTNEFTDISVAIPAPMTSENSGLSLSNRILSLSTRDLSVGEKVFTFAYPNTVHLGGEIPQIHFNPRFYEGRISQFYENGRDKTFLPSPCYETTITIHPGASGGPVFDCNGFVCGINSTGWAGVPDLSFVSRIHEALTIPVTDVSFGNESESVNVTVSILAKLGHVILQST